MKVYHTGFVVFPYNHDDRMEMKLIYQFSNSFYS